MWNKYTYNKSAGPLNRAYSMALNNSRMIKSLRQPGIINCIKVIVEHSHKKLITPENAQNMYDNNLMINSLGKSGYG